MAGRPTVYTPELFEKICDEIATSDIGLVHICKHNGLNAKTFYDWIKADIELSNKYARARELQAEYLADQILSIADDVSNDTIIDDETGRESANHEWINRSRLRVDARKWIASKLFPKKYGDKVDLTTAGEKINGVKEIIIERASANKD